jgi:hypothetical protein
MHEFGACAALGVDLKKSVAEKINARNRTMIAR